MYDDPQNQGSIHIHPPLALPPPGRDRGSPPVSPPGSLRIPCQTLNQTSITARPVPLPWGPALEGPSCILLPSRTRAPAARSSPPPSPTRTTGQPLLTTPGKPQKPDGGEVGAATTLKPQLNHFLPPQAHQCFPVPTDISCPGTHHREKRAAAARQR